MDETDYAGASPVSKPSCPHSPLALYTSAVLKVALLPDLAGHLKVQTTRARYEWKSLSEPEVRTELLRTDKLFSYQVPSPNLTGVPQPDAMRIDRKVDAECAADFQSYREFPNKWLTPATNPIFKSGWTSSTAKRHFAVGNTIFSVNQITDEVKRIFGLDRRTAIAACPLWQYYRITAEDLLQSSREIQFDVTGCKDMRAEPPQFSHADSSATIWIKGQAKQDAKWTITFHPLTYSLAGQVNDEPRIVPIYASNQMAIDVIDADNSATTLTFQPLVGPPHEFVLGQNSNGFSFMNSPKIGDTRRFFYKFSYPNTR